MKYFTVLIKCMDVSIVFRKAGEKEPVTQLVGKPSWLPSSVFQPISVVFQLLYIVHSRGDWILLSLWKHFQNVIQGKREWKDVRIRYLFFSITTDIWRSWIWPQQWLGPVVGEFPRLLHIELRHKGYMKIFQRLFKPLQCRSPSERILKGWEVILNLYLYFTAVYGTHSL